MKLEHPDFDAPDDASERKSLAPVICYPVDALPQLGLTSQAPGPDPDRDPSLQLSPAQIREQSNKVSEVLVPPRDARCFSVPAGHFFRITSVEGSQVGDLNLWSADDLSERFYAGKTRALHGTHLSTGDSMWSSFPNMRAMATIVADTLDWYGFDEFGCSVHDVIGTRCDPYTNNLLSSGGQYHYCCHSNLTRALATHTGMELDESESLVHDVLNVFMCTGFSRETGQYIMKGTPVRPGDYLEFFAEMDLLGGLSACPGGDCADQHSSDTASCHPLLVEVFKPADAFLNMMSPSARNRYDGTHGL